MSLYAATIPHLSRDAHSARNVLNGAIALPDNRIDGGRIFFRVGEHGIANGFPLPSCDLRASCLRLDEEDRLWTCHVEPILERGRLGPLAEWKLRFRETKAPHALIAPVEFKKDHFKTLDARNPDITGVAWAIDPSEHVLQSIRIEIIKFIDWNRHQLENAHGDAVVNWTEGIQTATTGSLIRPRCLAILDVVLGSENGFYCGGPLGEKLQRFRKALRLHHN